ncbi:hypothetical protein E2I00_008955 [Balaenoptera physalus]|uniref:Uncharacterized protein n=1 Tax=Balaenoptera physalus TaxID=9770 RepID=A0A6A1QBH9_BALPH|nr:hypothetical protein E2I00_008955 [Balaenoptera physalus]
MEASGSVGDDTGGPEPRTRPCGWKGWEKPSPPQGSVHILRPLRLSSPCPGRGPVSPVRRGEGGHRRDFDSVLLDPQQVVQRGHRVNGKEFWARTSLR